MRLLTCLNLHMCCVFVLCVLCVCRYGRKATMMAGGAAFLAGTALVTFAVHMVMLVLGRVVLGIGVGFATQVRGGSCTAWGPTFASPQQLLQQQQHGLQAITHARSWHPDSVAWQPC